jgi:hypothetical protein
MQRGLRARSITSRVNESGIVGINLESERPLGDKPQHSALNERDTHPAGGRRQGAIFVRLAPIAPTRQ